MEVLVRCTDKTIFKLYFFYCNYHPRKEYMGSSKCAIIKPLYLIRSNSASSVKE